MSNGGGGINSAIRVVLVPRADLDVGTERFRDLVADELLERLTGGTPDHLADQVTVVDHVIAGGRPGGHHGG